MLYQLIQGSTVLVPITMGHMLLTHISNSAHPPSYRLSPHATHPYIQQCPPSLVQIVPTCYSPIYPTVPTLPRTDCPHMLLTHISNSAHPPSYRLSPHATHPYIQQCPPSLVQIVPTCYSPIYPTVPTLPRTDCPHMLLTHISNSAHPPSYMLLTHISNSAHPPSYRLSPHATHPYIQQCPPSLVQIVPTCYSPIYPTVPTLPRTDCPSGICTARPRSDIRT